MSVSLQVFSSEECGVAVVGVVVAVVVSAADGAEVVTAGVVPDMFIQLR